MKELDECDEHVMKRVYRVFNCFLVFCVLVPLILMFYAGKEWQRRQQARSPKTATIVYKLYTPGYKYTMRAQTGARTVMMPAWQPDICQLVIYVHKQPKDTLLTLTVPASIYTRYNVLDTIKLNSK